MMIAKNQIDVVDIVTEVNIDTVGFRQGAL